MKRTWILWPIFFLLLSGCRGAAAAVPTRMPVAEMAVVQETAVASMPTPAATAVPISAPPATPTPLATITPSPTPLPTFTPSATPTATPIGPCNQRVPDDDYLLIMVSLEYGLGRDYEPADLTPLADHLPVEVTLGYPTEVRQIIIPSLVEMVRDMRAVGLQLTIISGYRSYASQAIAWDKWSREYPERAAIISAPPGFSEHQLGTTVDFGSPELPGIVGQEDIQFHTYFYQTGEGIWLAENAHKYGFTLSYPREAFELTGFYYEPWHYRYIGVEMATRLHEMGISLLEYQLINQPPPCIPAES